MPAGRCPSPELLHAYTTGRLALPAHEALDAHLDACPDCQQGVAALDARSDTPLPALQAPTTPVAFLDDPTFRQLVDRAKSLADGPAAGAVLGNYLLQEPLGAGGMGRVFKAIHCRM